MNGSVGSIGSNRQSSASQFGFVVSFGREGEVGHFVSEAFSAPTLEASVRRARSLLGLRRQLLGTELHSGPPWYVLLHLFESHVFQRRDTIGDVCNGTEVPATTVLRWLRRLEACGLVVARDDHLDNRRRFVELTPTGVETMSKYFQEITPHQIAA